MLQENIIKGSEWRKWDLHVHTPASGMANEYGSDWDLYVKTLFSLAMERNVAAIGITDYFTIEGYEKIKHDYLENHAKLLELFGTECAIAKVKSILLLPNIEFRLNQIVDSNRVNYHVIFSNEVSIQDIKENFLHEIDFVYEIDPFSKDYTRKLTRHNIECLGQKLKDEQSTFKGNNFEIGCQTAVVSDEQIRKILNSHGDMFRNKYLIAVPVDEDLSKVSWKGQGHQVRKLLCQQSNLFFASNLSTIDFGLGKKHDSKDDFLKEFKTLKACVIGSDAHSIEQLKEKFGLHWEKGGQTSKTTWIKADTTFEGLRQILCEPETRVKIQEMSPDNKADYQVIDSVILNNNKFWQQKIGFNSCMNTIIGGRSTGKSLLLQCIAKKVDPSIKIDNENRQVFIDSHLDDITVIWKDGVENSSRELMYFPQNYMIRLAENKEELDKLIEGIIRDKDEHHKLDGYKAFCNQNRIEISNHVNQFFLELSQLRSLSSEAKELGDIKGVQAEINKLSDKINSIKNNSSITSKELEYYNSLITKISGNLSAIQNVDRDLAVLNQLSVGNLFNAYYNNEFSSLSQLEYDKLFRELKTIKEETVSKWQEKIQEAKHRILLNKEALVKENTNTQSSAIYKKGQEYSLKNKEYSQLQSALKNEKDKLARISDFTDKISKKKDEIKKVFQEIERLHLLYHSKMQELIRLLQFADSRVSIIPLCRLKKKELSDFFEERHNLRGNERRDYINNFLVKYEQGKIEEVTKQYIRDTINGKIDYKNSYMPNNVTIELMATNWFDVTYEIKYEEDKFEDMSQGKKSFVILNLLLDFSNKKCPILLDQPEDSLDNRAIYNELVQYLRNKKEERQLIIVTHNANVVVSADSENVIVANQNGIKNKNSNSTRFQYKNGALENSSIRDSANQAILESRGIREHVCDILEGGEDAFREREMKYGLV